METLGLVEVTELTQGWLGDVTPVSPTTTWGYNNEIDIVFNLTFYSLYSYIDPTEGLRQ